jgi:23S rRNA pseudouridine2605 synthase
MSERIRLQRYLAQAGVASRRRAEVLIQEGRVRVNGRVVTELGTRVEPGKDRVEVGGQRVRPEDARYLLLHKPAGVITTLDDPQGRKTVLDLLPDDLGRLFPVGRLDLQTAGALLLTNDGELAHALTHPSKRVDKKYLARVRGEVDEATLAQLGRGVTLEDGPTAPARILVRAETSSHTWLEITVHEGRNRLIRRMCEAVGLQVTRLIRAEFAGLDTERLKPGEWRTLSAKEVARLRRLAGLATRRHRPRTPRRGGGRRRKR